PSTSTSPAWWRRVHPDLSTGSHPGGKAAAVVAGMAAGADSIEDLDLLRHGGMGRLFGSVYTPSTLGSFPRFFTWGHTLRWRPPPGTCWPPWPGEHRCCQAPRRWPTWMWTHCC